MDLSVNNDAESVQAKLDEIKSEFDVDEKKERKPGSGRKSKKYTEDQEVFVKSASFYLSSLANLITASFPSAIARPLSAAEVTNIDIAAGRVAEKYSHFLLEFAPELSLGLVLLAVFTPRIIDLVAYKNMVKKEDDRKRGTNHSDTGNDGARKDQFSETVPDGPKKSGDL